MKIQLAGGGDFPAQQQQTIQQPIVLPTTPEPDNTLLWATGVIVPVLIALLGVWAAKNRRV